MTRGTTARRRRLRHVCLCGRATVHLLCFSLHEEEDGLVWLPLLLFLLQPNNIGVPSILHGTELKPEVEYLY